jgi:hypothetical protein
MNNNNFADWELTQLLPDNKLHKNSRFLFLFDGKIHLKNHNWYTHQKKINSKIVKVAWTWEDVRLYLEDKGFTICYSANPKDCNAFVYKTNFDTDMFLNGYQEIRGTYEEARREAIIFILTLIN